MDNNIKDTFGLKTSQWPPPPQKIKFKERLCIFLTVHWRGIVVFLTPLISLFVIFGNQPTEKWQWCAYCLVVMAIFWVTECIPLPVTAFLPMVIFPYAQIMDTDTVCRCYMNDTLLMFLGSMVLAYSIEQCNLHVRLALCVVKTIGYSHYKLLFAVSLVTMFISMWITNTAATVMILPIVFALLKVFEDQGLMKIYDVDQDGEKVSSDIATCYFCSVTFSATVGGVGTLVGTATNLAFKGLFQKNYPAAPEYLSFPLFSGFGVPYMIFMEAFVYLSMIFVYFGFLRPKSKRAQNCKLNEVAKKAAKAKVESDWKKLGKITVWELWVIVLFSFAVLLFFCRSPQIFVGWGDRIKQIYGTKDKYVKDSTACYLATTFMMLLPNTCEFFKNFTVKTQAELPKKPIRSVLSWRIMDSKMPYSFLFLLGGGFALSTASKKDFTNLNGIIGDVLQKLHNLPNAAIILLLIIVTVFLTNFASNVAIANVLCPISMQMAKRIGYNPMWYCLASGFSASFCYCLPVGTPGNLVVQSSAHVPTNKMMKAGLGPTVSTVLITWIAMLLWAPIIWPSLRTIPDWAH